MSEIERNSNESDSAFNIEVSLRDWVSGESLIENKWVVCGIGTYSLATDSTSCEQCPDGAIWYGNNTMAPKEGYWRANNNTDFFFKCPFSSSWLGGELINGMISDTGKCETGYEGNKCQAWSDGYSRVSKNECYECPS